MNKTCTSGVYRPHTHGAREKDCWCRPVLVECACGGNHGLLWGHGEVEIRPDVRERMCVFSQ